MVKSYAQVPKDEPIMTNKKDFAYFMTEVQNIEHSIDKIRDQIDQLRAQHAQALESTVSYPEDRAIRDDISSSINVQSKQLRADIAIREAQIQKTSELGAGERQVLNNRILSLKNTFIGLLNSYQEETGAYKERIEKRIRKQVEIAGGSVDDEQLHDLIETGGQNVFAQGIVRDTQQAKMALSDMQSRATEIQKLERDISDINETYLQLAMLVDEQDHKVNSIEYNVEQAAASVEVGAQNTRKAVVNASKARKKKVFLGILGVVVILILLLVIYCSLFL